jgi:hypothetical protein
MPLDLALRILSLCVALAGVETLHGIARTVLVVPRIGKARALKLSIVTGSALAWGVCRLLVPDMGLHTAPDLLALGLLLAAFMAAFDIAMGRLVLRRPWHKIWPDFNPATGNCLLFGLGFLVLAPWLATRGG